MKRKLVSNIALFLLIFVVILILQLHFNIGYSDYAHDCEQYYNMGKSMFPNGILDLTANFEEWRGFYFPFYMGICSVINDILNIDNSYIYVSSLIISILLTVFINFCKEIFIKDQTVKYFYLRCGIFIALLLFFFYGILIYPLTDIYAALLCFSSLYCYYIFHKNNNKLFLFLSGCLLYITYNIRTIYIILLLFMIAFTCFYRYRNNKAKDIVINFSILILGIVIAAIPQIYINYIKHGSVSLLVNNGSLFSDQLFFGLRFSRYESYVGNQHKAEMYFGSKTGDAIINDIFLRQYPVNIYTYIRFFIKYPLEYIAMFGKHLFNACFLIFPEQYISDIYANRYIYVIMSLLLIVVFVVALYLRIKDCKPKIFNILILIGALLPTLAIMFGAVEQRFLIAPYLLIFAFISFFDFTKFKKLSKKEIVIIVLISLLFILASLAIESEILGNLNEFPIMFKS